MSIGLVEGNEAVAGGVLNPSTGEMFWGSQETGLQTSGHWHSNAAPSNDGDDSRRTAVSHFLSAGENTAKENGSRLIDRG